MNPNPHNLRDLVRRLIVTNGTFDRSVRPCGAEISTTRAYALLTLNEASSTVTELSQKLLIDRTNVSRLCQKMMGDSEILMKPSATDKRAKVVSLTAKGRKLAQSIDASSAKYFSEIMQHIDDPDAVMSALEMLSDAIQKVRNHA